MESDGWIAFALALGGPGADYHINVLDEVLGPEWVSTWEQFEHNQLNGPMSCRRGCSGRRTAELIRASKAVVRRR